MLAVTNTGDVEVIVKPATTSPRRNPKKRSRLVAEHQRRKGDPAVSSGRRAELAMSLPELRSQCRFGFKKIAAVIRVKLGH